MHTVLFSAPKSGQVSTRSVHQEEVAGLSESISEFAYLGEADKEFAPVTDAKEKPGKDQLKVSVAAVHRRALRPLLVDY